MKILVTGASGLIGHRVVALAAEQGLDVIASSRRQPRNLPDDVPFVACDLAQPEAAGKLIKEVQPDALIQTAWLTTQPSYWHDPVNLVWIGSSLSMAMSFADLGRGRFIQVGSCAEYDWSDGLCVEAETLDRPATRYGKAKLAAYNAVEAAAQDRFEVVGARIFFVYGPRENPARLIPTICRSHLAGKIPELSSGKQWRELLYVDDAARALLMLALAQGVTGIINIAASRPVQLAEVARNLAQVAGASDDGLGKREDRPGDPERLLATSDRLRATGWVPQVSLQDGLEKTFHWWREQTELESNS